ncbi:MAG: LPS export ABC transporter periplasmic protein LptC [Armatimonadota bacterium]|nr:LPS export ABC transporter periplasmic protein LptC [Armatimonadota bacterium]
MKSLVRIGNFILVLVCCAWAGVLWGQDSGTQLSGQAGAANEKKRTETVTYQAKLLKAVWGQEDKVILTGGVKFTHGDTVLTCDEVQYDRKTGIATSSGRITISDPECDIVADKGVVYFKKRLGVLEGSVTLLVKPKPEEEQTSTADKTDSESIRARFTKPTTVTCAKLDYDYRSKIAVASGGVKLSQDKRIVTAEKLVYDDRNQLVTLIGNVTGVDEEGQTFRSPDKVTICIKRGAEWMEAPNATATFKVEIEEESTNK